MCLGWKRLNVEKISHFCVLWRHQEVGIAPHPIHPSNNQKWVRMERKRGKQVEENDRKKSWVRKRKKKKGYTKTKKKKRETWKWSRQKEERKKEIERKEARKRKKATERDREKKRKGSNRGKYALIREGGVKERRKWQWKREKYLKRDKQKGEKRCRWTLTKFKSKESYVRSYRKSFMRKKGFLNKEFEATEMR